MSNHQDDDKTLKTPKWKKTRSTARFAGRWLTPWGVLKTVYDGQVKANQITPDSEIGDFRIARIQAWGSIIATLLGIALVSAGLNWLSSLDQDRSSLSVGGALCLTVAMLLLLKLRVHIKNLFEISRRANLTEGGAQKAYAKPKSTDFEMDDVAKGVFLFRSAVFRTTYYLTALFAACLLLTPSNIHGIRTMLDTGWVTFSHVGMIVSSNLILVGILIVKGGQAAKDLRFVLQAGATPNLVGYTTINNNVHIAIQYAIIALLAAFVGDRIAEWLSTADVSLAFAAIIRPLVLLAVMAYGVTVLRSATALSGLQTAEGPHQVGIRPVLRFCIGKLPPPPEEEARAQVLPPIPIIAALLFAAAVWVTTNTGWISMLTAVTAMMPIAILLTVHHFHPYLVSDNDAQEVA